GLAQHVVDLVRTSVVQVFSLEENSCATSMLTEAGGLVQRRRPAGVVRLQPVEFVEVRLVGAHLLVSRSDFLDHGHQGLSDKPAPIRTEMTAGVWIVMSGFSDRGAGTRKFGVQGICHHERSTCKRLIGFAGLPGRLGARRML